MKTKITFLIMYVLMLSTYSQTKLDSKLNEFWNGSSWQNSSKSTYLYNANNNLSQETSFYFDSGSNSWIEQEKITYTYDGNNNILQTIYQDWVGGQWVNSSKEVRTYTGNNINQLISYDWVSNQWTNSYKATVTYVSSNIINQVISQEWNGSQWINSERSNYTYNANNKIDTITSDEWNGSQWNVLDKEIFTYDANNKIATILTKDWNGSQFTDSNLEEFQLDTNYNRLSSIETDYTSTPNYKYRTANTYDTTALMSNIINPFNDNVMYDLGFEDNPYVNKVLQETISNFDYNSNQWNDNYKTTYHYNNTASANNTILDDNIKIFPNPTTDFVNIKSKTTLESVKVFDYTGKLLINTQKPTISLKKLSNGFYKLQVTNINGSVSTKTILKQ